MQLHNLVFESYQQLAKDPTISSLHAKATEIQMFYKPMHPRSCFKSRKAQTFFEQKSDADKQF